MDVVRLIEAKRDNQELLPAELEQLIAGFARGEVPDYQMAAFAMAVACRSMTSAETMALTRAMRDSGECLTWQPDNRPLVDKHSTGGIGDKVSLLLAPLLIACGCRVPMISGRGLGATGGTLDKLESFQGLCVELDTARFQKQVNEVGGAIVAASSRLAPADRKLYALRDVTGTVPSIPLITASILSRKLAEAPQTLVLDVKVGSGAFMKTLDQARSLAQSLVQVATGLGIATMAWITDMNQPLGEMVGNSVEVDESRRLLKSPRFETTLCQLTLTLASEGLYLAGLAESLEQAQQKVTTAWESGAAYEAFARMIAAQGGDPEERFGALPGSPIELAERAAVDRDAAQRTSQRDCLRILVALVAWKKKPTPKSQAGRIPAIRRFQAWSSRKEFFSQRHGVAE